MAQILVLFVEQIEGQGQVNATKVLPSACHGCSSVLGSFMHPEIISRNMSRSADDNLIINLSRTYFPVRLFLVPNYR